MEDGGWKDGGWRMDGGWKMEDGWMEERWRMEAENVDFTEQIEAFSPKMLKNTWFLKNFGGGKQKTLILLSKTAENHHKP